MRASAGRWQECMEATFLVFPGHFSAAPRCWRWHKFSRLITSFFKIRMLTSSSNANGGASHAGTSPYLKKRSCRKPKETKHSRRSISQVLKRLCLHSGRRWSVPLCWFCWYLHLLEEICSWASPLTQEAPRTQVHVHATDHLSLVASCPPQSLCSCTSCSLSSFSPVFWSQAESDSSGLVAWTIISPCVHDIVLKVWMRSDNRCCT